MPSENDTIIEHRTWRMALAEELREYLFNFAFLCFFLVAFAWYRRLVLAEYHIQYLRYWMPIVEAALLAKIIMIGDMLRMGRRMRNWPLVVPTMYRTIIFSLLVVAFSVLEHIAGALIHGKTAADGIAELTNKGWDELISWYVLVIAAFLPFFAVKEIERHFGRSRVRSAFFRRSAGERGPL